MRDLETAWAEAMRNGVPPSSAALDPLLARYRDWVALMWNKPCPPDAFAGLADLHLSHPDFVARHETIAPGFSAYRAEAMKAYAGRLAT